MGDAGVREAERRWRATGAVEDRAEWLRLRVRAGELTAEQVQRAGYAGDAAAQMASELPADWSSALRALDDSSLAGTDPLERLRGQLAHLFASLSVEHGPAFEPEACRSLLNMCRPRDESEAVRRPLFVLAESWHTLVEQPDVARKRGKALAAWATVVAIRVALSQVREFSGEDLFPLPASPLAELLAVARRVAPSAAIEAASAALAARQLEGR